jgi:hypothetical protein
MTGRILKINLINPDGPVLVFYGQPHFYVFPCFPVQANPHVYYPWDTGTGDVEAWDVDKLYHSDRVPNEHGSTIGLCENRIKATHLIANHHLPSFSKKCSPKNDITYIT